MCKCKEENCEEKIELNRINSELDMGAHKVKIDGKYCPVHYKEVIEFLADITVTYPEGKVENNKFPYW